MNHPKSPEQYYNELAKNYDANRFGNSYGKFIHKQEKRFMQGAFSASPKEQILSVACGTGRFMEYASHGLDIAPKMLIEAKKKFPDKKFIQGAALELPFEDNSLTGIFSLHFLMHLNKIEAAQFLVECYRVLKPGGKLVLDFPSEPRRKLFNHKQEGWHGANAYSLQQWKLANNQNWRLQRSQGVLFFPIHRIPLSARKFFIGIDNLLCVSPLKSFASYLLVEMKKI